MADLSLGFALKDYFFDRSGIEKALGKAHARAFAQAGALLRRTAQTSMRYRKKPSPAGQPPSAHRDRRRGPLLRKLIFFAYDPDHLSLVVGPIRLGQSRVAEVQEKGGTVRQRRRLRPAGRQRPTLTRAQQEAFRRLLQSGRIKLRRPPALVSVTLPPRPYMGPALVKQSPNLPPLWADSVKG